MGKVVKVIGHRSNALFSRGPGGNQPAGMTKLFQLDPTQWDQSVQNPGGSPFVGTLWQTPEVSPDYGAFFNLSDPAAPDKVYEHRFKVGAAEGRAGIYTHGWTIQTEVYFRMVFRLSSNWQEHPTGTTKLWYWNASGGQICTIMLENPHNPSRLAVAMLRGEAREFHSNTGYISLDTWHEIEVHAVAESAQGASDGKCYVWFDGAEVTGWTRLGDNVQFTRLEGLNWTDDADFRIANRIQIGPFWGGSGGHTKSVNDWWRTGELYVSGKA